MSEWAIRADGLVKSFGETRAVDGLDLAVPAGGVYGFLARTVRANMRRDPMMRIGQPPTTASLP
jgi:hypothetical protein